MVLKPINVFSLSLGQAEQKYHDTNNPTFVFSGPSIADSAQLLLIPDQDKDQHEDGWVLHVLL